jgi:hypothetical protein
MKNHTKTSTVEPRIVREAQVIVPDWMERVLDEAEREGMMVEWTRAFLPFGTYTMGLEVSQIAMPVNQEVANEG